VFWKVKRGQEEESPSAGNKGLSKRFIPVEKGREAGRGWFDTEAATERGNHTGGEETRGRYDRIKRKRNIVSRSRTDFMKKGARGGRGAERGSRDYRGKGKTSLPLMGSPRKGTRSRGGRT